MISLGVQAWSYERRDEGFAYLASGSAHVMLEQLGAGRNWITGPLRNRE